MRISVTTSAIPGASGGIINAGIGTAIDMGAAGIDYAINGDMNAFTGSMISAGVSGAFNMASAGINAGIGAKTDNDYIKAAAGWGINLAASEASFWASNAIGSAVTGTSFDAGSMAQNRYANAGFVSGQIGSLVSGVSTAGIKNVYGRSIVSQSISNAFSLTGDMFDKYSGLRDVDLNRSLTGYADMSKVMENANMAMLQELVGIQGQKAWDSSTAKKNLLLNVKTMNETFDIWKDTFAQERDKRILNRLRKNPETAREEKLKTEMTNKIDSWIAAAKKEGNTEYVTMLTELKEKLQNRELLFGNLGLGYGKTIIDSEGKEVSILSKRFLNGINLKNKKYARTDEALFASVWEYIRNGKNDKGIGQALETVVSAYGASHFASIVKNIDSSAFSNNTQLTKKIYGLINAQKLGKQFFSEYVLSNFDARKDNLRLYTLNAAAAFTPMGDNSNLCNTKLVPYGMRYEDGFEEKASKAFNLALDFILPFNPFGVVNNMSNRVSYKQTAFEFGLDVALFIGPMATKKVVQKVARKKLLKMLESNKLDPKELKKLAKVLGNDPGFQNTLKRTFTFVDETGKVYTTLPDGYYINYSKKLGYCISRKDKKAVKLFFHQFSNPETPKEIFQSLGEQLLIGDGEGIQALEFITKEAVLFKNMMQYSTTVDNTTIDYEKLKLDKEKATELMKKIDNMTPEEFHDYKVEIEQRFMEEIAKRYRLNSTDTEYNNVGDYKSSLIRYRHNDAVYYDLLAFRNQLISKGNYDYLLVDIQTSWEVLPGPELHGIDPDLVYQF